MKTPAEHTAHQDHTPVDVGAIDMHEPIYDGKWGYTTEAEKQALIASLDQAERDLEDGKDMPFDHPVWKAEREQIIKELKAEGIPD
jgi:hypothetical protein